MNERTVISDHQIDLASLDADRVCFVICPIGGEGSDIRKRSNQVLEHVIRPAATANGSSRCAPITFRSRE